MYDGTNDNLKKQTMFIIQDRLNYTDILQACFSFWVAAFLFSYFDLAITFFVQLN